MQHLLAVLLVLLGLLSAALAWVQWARAERAVRRGDPLPSTPFSAVLALGLVLCAGVVLASMA